MKIVNDDRNREPLDLDTLIEDAFQKYDAVFFSEIDGYFFAYRPLGRKEYKDIYNNVNLSDLDKQDAICNTVLIYPEEFDFDDCVAGVPNKLYLDIIEKSCLDPESMYYLLNMNREEAEQLGSEMACIIAEAFPSYTLDEIEAWNNFKFMKVYAQAEWVLVNIRGIEFKLDIADYLAQIAGIEGLDKEEVEEVLEEVQPRKSFKEQQEPAQQSQNNSAKGMSQEQLRAYQEFVKQHPEFADAMQYDAAFTGFESQTADTVNPALRPGWYHNH